MRIYKQFEFRSGTNVGMPLSTPYPWLDKCSRQGTTTAGETAPNTLLHRNQNIY